MFSALFAQCEIRTLTLVAFGINVCYTPFDMLFTLRKNEENGISDDFLVWFDRGLFTAINVCFIILPLLTLFAKIIPKRIEGTSYAFITSFFNLSQTF
jgi:hypothetical protein